MKKALLFQILLWLFIFCSFNIIAQRNIPTDLAQQLSGKKKFAEIEKTVNDYYAQKISQKRARSQATNDENRQLKHWNRYFWYASRHLNTDGEVEDISKRMLEYIEQEKKNSNKAKVANSYNGEWKSYGPHFVDDGIGRIDRLAFHPTNPDIVYAGSPAGGLYKSSNAIGTEWTALSEYAPTLGVSGIVVDYSAPNTLYVLSGDGDRGNPYSMNSQGVFKTTDGGSTWNKTGVLFGGEYVGWQLKQHPTNAQTLFACTNVGLYKTINGGNTWNEVVIRETVLFDIIIDSTAVWDLEFKPNDPNTIYVSYNNNKGFAKSTDGGNTFYNANVGLNDCIGYKRIELTVTPTLPNNVYLLAGKEQNLTEQNWSPFVGLFISTESGTNFDRKSNSPNIFGTEHGSSDGPNRSQSDYDIALFVNPQDPNQILMGGISIWRSGNGGINWEEIIDWSFDHLSSNFGDADYVHADIHSIVQNPLNNRVYAACDGGISYTDDMGDNWNQIHNIPVTMFYKIEGNDQNDKLWGGTQDNGILVFEDDETDNIYNYHTEEGGDGYDVMTDNNNRDDKYWSVNEKVYTDGVTTENITPPDGIGVVDNTFFKILAMKPNDEDVIYCGTGLDAYRSGDKGDSWTEFDVNSNCNGALSVCPNLINRLYTGGNYFFRIDLWTVTNITPPDFYKPAPNPNNETWAFTTGVAVDPNNADKVWITVGGYGDGKKVYYSSNAGATWQNKSGSLPNLPIYSIKFDGSGNLYIGTEVGVYYRNAINGTDWIPFYNGLPRVPVTDIEVRLNAQLSGKKEIIAATFGRGIWRTDPFSNCESVVNVSGNSGGQLYYQAGHTLNSSQNLKGTIGTDVIYKAGTEIRLTDGFKIGEGAKINIKTSPCN